MNQDERLRELLTELVSVLNDVFTDNDQIKDTIRNIETEGYEVDLFLATVTRILRKNRSDSESLFNAFDRSFTPSESRLIDGRAPEGDRQSDFIAIGELEALDAFVPYLVGQLVLVDL